MVCSWEAPLVDLEQYQWPLGARYKIEKAVLGVALLWSLDRGHDWNGLHGRAVINDQAETLAAAERLLVSAPTATPTHRIPGTDRAARNIAPIRHLAFPD